MSRTQMTPEEKPCRTAKGSPGGNNRYVMICDDKKVRDIETGEVYGEFANDRELAGYFKKGSE